MLATVCSNVTGNSYQKVDTFKAVALFSLGCAGSCYRKGSDKLIIALDTNDRTQNLALLEQPQGGAYLGLAPNKLWPRPRAGVEFRTPKPFQWYFLIVSNNTDSW